MKLLQSSAESGEQVDMPDLDARRDAPRPTPILGRRPRNERGFRDRRRSAIGQGRDQFGCSIFLILSASFLIA